MRSERSVELVRQFWNHIKNQEWESAKKLLTVDFECSWPQSNEKFKRDQFIEVNSTYPGNHEIRILDAWSENKQQDRIVTVISEVHIKSETPEGVDVELFALSLFELEDDGECLIRSAREYWAETYSAPTWRKHLSTSDDFRRKSIQRVQSVDRIIHTILYVSDQKRSKDFYSKVLRQDPILNVPGMTEFQLSKNHVLGLMPETGIKKLLGAAIEEFTLGSPKAELYVRVPNPEEMFTNAIKLGAKVLSPIQNRDWGDRAGYVMDYDSNILAFATCGGN